jgi:hypothetical protein
MIARIDPSWIMMVKTPPGSSKPISRLAINKCAVDDTGRNSVSPCNTPSTAAFRRDGIRQKVKSEKAKLKVKVKSDGSNVEHSQLFPFHFDL